MNATDTPKAIPIAAPGEGTIATRVAAGLGLRPTLLLNGTSSGWQSSTFANPIPSRSSITSNRGNANTPWSTLQRPCGLWCGLWGLWSLGSVVFGVRPI